MLMRKFAATSAMLIAALGVAAGTVHAAPAQKAPAGVNVSYKIDEQKKSISLTADAGSVAVEDHALKIKAADGTVMAGTPLEFRVDDYVFPVAAEIKDKTATLTPKLDVEHAVYKPVALPFEDQAQWKTPYDREKDAFNRMKDTIGLGATASSIISGVIGGIIGCGLGAIAGTALTGPLATLLGAGPLAGCLIGGAALAGAFALVGTILITTPVAIAAVIQYFTTINQPFTPPAK
ncbi:hypothetical protein [Nocardia transvalensis]|uniref:hypothetical protein n=1 Tax=Nocardia transvalensis TaxID=37333 RepID=UPI001894A41D|nr:hypothetical protein [Nocardia transvalensis]MBF6328555.1 hypothetical protein [Nocardia transvalensis]